MALRIGQSNVGRSRLAMNKVHIVAAQRGLDVLLLQELYLCSGKLLGLPATFWCVYESHDQVWCAVVITNPTVDVLHTPIVERHFVAVGLRYQSVDLFAMSAYFQYSVPTQKLWELSWIVSPGLHLLALK